MASYHGRDGAVYVEEGGSGGGDVLECVSWSYSENTEETEVVAIGDDAKRYLGGLTEGSGTFTVNWDPADTRAEALDMADTVEVSLRPRGTGAGLPEFTSVGNGTGLVTVTGMEVSGDVGSVVQRTFTFRGKLVKATQ